ncbi:MAG TPA: MFS transporter [Cyclobacteriaceae bacterium]|nr:MFS transporter [Cyclobacteriaceae bacterium]
MSRPATSKIYNTQFWLLCLSSLLFFASFNMIIPELPAYLTSLGGAEYKGLIISLFTLTAMISRPFSGRLADKYGRVPVIIFGSAVCFICGFLYPVLSSVTGFLFIRLVHGFSTGFTPTGQSAYLSDVIPAERRGEAMGLLGTAGSIGMAAGPSAGGLLANHFSINFLFYCSSFLALLAIIILKGVRETLPVRNKFSLNMMRIRYHDLFDFGVWIPCFVMVLSAFAYGTMLTIVPDFGDYTGIRNKGLLFAFFTIASLAVRLIGGKASDRFGRKSILKISVTLIVVAMTWIAFADDPGDLIVGMSLYGLGHGMTAPTLLAWATDLSDPKHKGRGIASLYVAMELGIGSGALISAMIYDNSAANFMNTFLTCAFLGALAFLFLMLVPAPQITTE